ncbi:MAG: hypothetical protein NC079_04625 [Clostridium sp.]|nr:hypothetical protein [Bacteroides sp.]MCM1562876.1 hypothetical protein [Clostridium sp.]
MRDRFHGGRTVLSALLMGVAVIWICLAGTGINARGANYFSFGSNAELLTTGQDTYDIQITVENWGPDWEGTARLAVQESAYSQPSAYDMPLSLPMGSTKQFTVRVPKDSVGNEDATVSLVLLDEDSNETSRKEFGRLFQSRERVHPLGILSDSYKDLTWLDMGGRLLYYRGDSYPIKLVETDATNLTEMLDTLVFLVIDDYDTSVLTDEDVKAIELWVDGGGMLIVGTGSRAEEVLDGLDFLGVECLNVLEPGDGRAPYDISLMAQFAMAELDYGGAFTDANSGGYCYVCPMGDGAAGIIPYSLTEYAQVYSANYGNDLADNILEMVGDASRLRYDIQGNSNNDGYTLSRMLRFLGNGNNRISFGILKVFIVLYVIFVGPGLYLILRLLKKRDLYWVLVPASALLSVLLVFLFGRGFEVASTRVYSVTIENLANQGSSKTYLHCYDAGHGEWSLRLAEHQVAAGPHEMSSYFYGDNEYYYHIQREGDRLAIGIRPSQGFEDSYFVTYRDAGQASGSLKVEGMEGGLVSTRLTNGTDRDLSYVAVVMDNYLYVMQNLPAGQSCEVSYGPKVIYESHSQLDNVRDTYFRSVMREYLHNSDADALAALGLGLCEVSPQMAGDEILIIGVTQDWDKVVDDNCGETSYGCLYVIQ